MKSRLMWIAAALAVAGPAHAEERKINIAIFAPNTAFASGSERFSYVNRLAQHVTSVAGVKAEGKAFARAGDLEAAIKAKQVDFAILDGVYLAERGAPYPVLAVATTGGETAPKWALFTSGSTDAKGLQGKRLAMARVGARDDDFLSNALFDGEVQVKKFFASRVDAPDLAGALATVNLKKAEAVFAPESEGKGLKNVFEAGRIPNPAFCDLQNGTPSDVVAKVRSAVLAYSAGAALEGWKPSDAGAYRALSGRMSARNRRPLMAEPTVVKLEDLDVLVPPQFEAAQPDLRALFLVPLP